MAAHTTFSVEMRLAQVVVEGNGLMTPILTGSVTTTTTDAFLMVEGGIYHGVAVKVGGQIELGQQFTNQIVNVLDTPLSHIMLQTQNHVTWQVYKNAEGYATVYLAQMGNGVIRIGSSSEDPNDPAVIDILNSIKLK